MKLSFKYKKKTCENLQKYIGLNAVPVVNTAAGFLTFVANISETVIEQGVQMGEIYRERNKGEITMALSL